MNMVFKVGDLVRLKKDSWWVKRSQTFREMIAGNSLVLVTDSLEESDRFFYGIICGDSSKVHLWSSDQFDLVQEAVQ